MGDRGNIRFDFGTKHGTDEPYSPIYLYGHWHGYQMPSLLQTILRDGKGRWGDEPYLCRYITTRMVDAAGDTHQETGWGLSPYITDNQYPVTVCDLERSTVQIGTARWTFEQYVALDAGTIQQVYGASKKGEPQP